MVNNIRVNDGFIANALRNCGYTNISAIADIIDNSIEPSVQASEVNIELRGDSTISEIVIYDNGDGMSSETLKEAMALGSRTGKTPSTCLGMYGTGMKAAAFSIGRYLQVITKRAEDDMFHVARIDLTNEIERNQGILVESLEIDPQDLLNQQVYALKYLAHKDNVFNGTIVCIGDLDRLTNKNRKNFNGCLKSELGILFNKYIFNKNVKINIDGQAVQPIDPIPNGTGDAELMNSGEIDVSGHTVGFRCYWIPDDGTGEATKSGRHRNMRTQGLYIYRQHRLVGQGVWLGVVDQRHPSLNGFRAEIFVDGSADYMFGSTFTKMVADKDKNLVNQEFVDKLKGAIGEMIKISQSRGKQEMEMSKPDDPETQKLYADAVRRQNGNLLLAVDRRGENTKRDAAPTVHEPRGPQEHPNPFRERQNKWLDSFGEYKGGKYGEMYKIEILKANLTQISINVEHPFYTEFFVHLPKVLKIKMIQIISCEELAKKNLNYYGSDEVASLIDQFLGCKYTEIGKSLV